MSISENKQAKPMDRTLMRASQILTKTFSKPNGYQEDMDLLVNPGKSDFAKKTHKHSENDAHEDDHDHDHPHDHPETKLSNLTPYLLLGALCLDGFFEGIALGLQSTPANVLFVAGAIVINKIAIAFGLGFSFKQAEIEIQTFIRFILLFSLFCPFGIVIGYFTAPYELWKGILLSVSTGTFIYVSCSVVIVEEFAITKYKFSKYFCFMLGAFATAGIAVIGQI